FGPLVDVLGMRLLLRFAFLCHFVGPLVMILAPGFEMLFVGALIIALANGTIEAVCNPLVATVYQDDKTHKLNQFHVWFPGGIVIGGLLAFGIDKLGAGFWEGMPLAAWQAKIALVLIPTIIYGILFTGQEFPLTERVQSGLSFGDMVRETVLRPLFIVLFICMAVTASLELGPNRWMGAVMTSAVAAAWEGLGDGAGILVLVYGSGLMAVLRFFAGPVVHKLSPTGLLVCSAVLSGVGLMALTFAQGLFLIFVAATIFYLGVCYFWPTMLGVASERVPKGGSLALALLGGWGMAVVGWVTVPVMGAITDHVGHSRLDVQQTVACVRQGAELLPAIRERLNADPEGNEKAIKRIDEAIKLVAEVNAAGEDLSPGKTAKALRSIAVHAPESEAGKRVPGLMKPADDHGGLVSFRVVACLSIVIIVVFGILYGQDRARGGYKIEKIGREPGGA
ncbi:MAG TPA: hypothetical protein VM492_09285, partial [Sumerlaeia bacterium]|nr:hypothetical protein [Sumerlaeia bacterium]